MASYYRTVSSIGVILGINIIARLLSLPVESDYILGNHLVESAAAFAIITLLIDLKIIGNEIQGKYLRIGLLSFFIGIIYIALSFSSLFVFSGFITIVAAWFRIAPQVIFLVGIPTLYFANKLSQKNKFLGMDNVGKKGLINIFIISTLYTMLAIYLLNKYNFLVL